MAFINVLLFDKNYNFVDLAFTQVSDDAATSHEFLERVVTISEEGYAFIYLSNENPTMVDVYFDDVSVTYTPSNIIQSTDYYPFGHQTDASWTRTDVQANQYLYNAGSELNSTTGSYEMFFREYDPLIGRMNAIDPMAGKYSSLTPYNYALNDPVFWNDPMGDDVGPEREPALGMGTVSGIDPMSHGVYDWSEIDRQIRYGSLMNFYTNAFTSTDYSRVWSWSDGVTSTTRIDDWYKNNADMYGGVDEGVLSQLRIYAGTSASDKYGKWSFRVKTDRIGSSIAFNNPRSRAQAQGDTPCPKCPDSGDIATGISLTGEGLWLLGEHRSRLLYDQGWRRGIKINYLLTGRNFSLFGSRPMVESTKPFTKLTKIGVGVSNFGTGLAIAGGLVDTYRFGKGTLSGSRWSFRVTGTTASILTASYIGGLYGAGVGLVFLGVEKAWDLSKPFRDETVRQYWNFANALKSGWRPR